MRGCKDKTNGGKDSSITDVQRNAMKKKQKRSSSDFSVIAAETKFFGNVFSCGKIDVLGHMHGDASADSVSVKESGYLDGDIIAKDIFIGGDFKGNIVCNSLCCGPNSRLKGSFVYSSINIVDGAVVHGSFSCKEMDDDTITAMQGKKLSDVIGGKGSIESESGINHNLKKALFNEGASKVQDGGSIKE
ncbi:polymer-forming cytoskeletal protein [Rickettsiales bacterium]|nr:polymer-forming cytoskeletal protein [Rickettsiales bacterium]